jgi:hypothetical protein
MTIDWEDPNETFLPIEGMDEWADFWAANGDDIGCDEYTARKLAQNSALLIGGGAAPLFRVGFVD